MKHIVKFSTVNRQGNVTLDAYNPDFQTMEMWEILDQYLPYTRLFECITIKNFITIPAELLSRLTNQYLHGAEIKVITPSRKFSNTYQLSHDAPAFYAYKYTPLDLTKPVPRSLAEFKFEYPANSKKYITYLDALKKGIIRSAEYMPNEFWTGLDKYSEQQISKCREYNQGEYIYAEEWYKQLMHDCVSHSIKVFSPNKKTYFEVIAEIDFEKQCDSYRLKKGLRPLSDNELRYLQKYAPAYGIEVPTFKWKINSRKTEHGYTQEPEMCSAGMSTTDWSRVIFDPRNNNNLPKFVREGLNIRECDNAKLLREAYFQLKWLMKHLKDDGLMPGYKRCPVCHQIYRESEGCECGNCLPLTFVNADNLFYGNSSTYEDYEITGDAYNDLDDNLTFEIIEELG